MYVSTEDWALWEAERHARNDAYRREEDARKQRELSGLLDDAVQRIQALELQVYLTELFLDKACLMLCEKEDALLEASS